MKSSIVFRPGRKNANKRVVMDWHLFMSACAALSDSKKQKVQLTIQHSLRQDELAVLLELPKESVSFHDKNPSRVVRYMTDKVLDLIFKECRDVQAQQKKERPSGKTSSRGDRRKSAARKRCS